MPTYSIDQETYPESVWPDPYPCEVVNGRGEVVPNCLLADTDTGEVIRLICAADGGLLRVRCLEPLPLVLHPLDFTPPRIVSAP